MNIEDLTADVKADINTDMKTKREQQVYFFGRRGRKKDGLCLAPVSECLRLNSFHVSLWLDS